MDDYGGIDPDLLYEANLLLDYELAKIRSPSSSELQETNVVTRPSGWDENGVDLSLRADPFGLIPAGEAGGWVLVPETRSTITDDMRRRLGPIGGGDRKTDVFQRLSAKSPAPAVQKVDIPRTTQVKPPTFPRPLNPGRFQNHANLKVVPVATPRPPQKFEEVKVITKQQRQKLKREKAKARKRENNVRIAQIKNPAAHLVLPPKPDPIPNVSVIHVSAGPSLSDQDVRVSSTSGEPQYSIRPTPANCYDDYDYPEDDWGDLEQLDLNKGHIDDDFGYSPPRRSYPTRKVGHKGLRFVAEMPPLPGSSPNPPPATRPVDWNFTHKKCELEYYIVSDQWLVLERSLQLLDMFRANTVQKMPEDTLAEIVEHGHSVHLRGNNFERFHPFYNESPSPGNAAVQRLLREIERTRLMCVNTEGKEQLMPDGVEPRVNVAVGSFDGTVLYFNDYHLIPESILKMFADPKYTKIGSGLINEMAPLKLVKARLRNWVEIGSLRMALYPPAWEMFQQRILDMDPKDYHQEVKIGHGIDYMVRDLVYAGYYPQEYFRTKFDHTWNWKRYKFKKEGIPPKEMLPHLLENVRTPFAELILIVDLFAKLRGYDLTEEPFWPIAYEALDLCRLKSPEVFQVNLNEDWTIFNWMARISTGHRVDHLSLPGQCMEMEHFLHSRADFVEPYLKEDLNQIAEEIFQRFFGPDGIEFPTYEFMQRLPLRTLLETRCSTCGRISQADHRCTGINPGCTYDHDGETFPPHSTLCCPNLHNHCWVCMTVGHSPSVHDKPALLKTGRELRKRFLAFAPRGLFTALPFLVNHPQGRLRLAAPFWKASYDGKRYNSAVVMRYLLGIARFVPLSLLGEERRRKEEELHRAQDRKLMDAVHENAICEDLNFRPISRELRKDEMVKARAEEKKKNLSKDEMAKAAKAQRRVQEKIERQRGIEKRQQAAREKAQNEKRKVVISPPTNKKPPRPQLFRRK